VRKLLFLFLFLLVLVPVYAIDSVTVAQLGQKLNQLSGKSDRHIANEVSNLELTERLDRSRMEEWSRSLPGEKSRAALLAVADASIFLAPPPAEIAPDPAPDKKTQGQILLRALDFVSEESRRMPNFLAERVTTRFQDAKWYPYSTRISYFTPRVYHLLDQRTANVRYVGGEEEEIKPNRSAKKKERDITLSPKGLTTWGAFGPLLPIVMGDILQSKAGWDRWDRSTTERLAVFRFFVPQQKSHYILEYCCGLAAKGAAIEFKALPAYHGEITIEPDTGHIRRVVLVCDLAHGQVIDKASVELEYGPVEIAGQKYFLPLHGVSASVVPASTSHLGEGGTNELVGSSSLTSINDLRFQNYRVFRTEMRIVPEQVSGDPEPPNPQPQNPKPQNPEH